MQRHMSMDNPKALITMTADEEWLRMRRPCGGIASRRTYWYLPDIYYPRGIKPAILGVTGERSASIPPTGGEDITRKLGFDYNVTEPPACSQGKHID